MTKTPEELTEDWKAGELEYGQYWVKNKVWEKPFIDRWLPNCSWKISCKDAIEQILAPVPTYDEYKAMQAELAEHRHYCCCSENEVMRLKLAEMEELLKGCKLSTFKIYDRLRFSDENEITPADLINAVDEIKPMLWGILNSINAALGGSEEKW